MMNVVSLGRTARSSAGSLAPGHVHTAAHVEGAERGRAVRDERVERARAGLEEAVYGEQLEPAARRHGDHTLITH